jgi:hypothetical protein
MGTSHAVEVTPREEVDQMNDQICDLKNSVDGSYLVDPYARSAAHELKARYFYYIDTRQFDRLPSLFTEDARLEGFAFDDTQIGVDQFVTSVKQFVDGRHSQHHAFMPMLRAVSDTVVRARWSMRDLVTWEPGEKSYRNVSHPDLSGFVGYGYYEDEYRLTGGAFKIQFLRIARVRIELLYGPRPADNLGALDPNVEWLP